MKSKENVVIYCILILSTVVLLYLHRVTHFDYLLELSGAPFEILVTVFILDRFLRARESRERRRRLLYIKSIMFRSDMRGMFIENVNAVKIPDVSMKFIRAASLAELKARRANADKVVYPSPESMEPIIMEYVQAEHVWKNFMDLAIANDFDDVFQGMVYIMNFVEDVKHFKKKYPDRLFIHHAMKHPHLMRKVEKVLGDGIRAFLDYAIQLKEHQPEMFEEVFSSYEEEPAAANTEAG